jgi:hemolysin activation/secretion protein
MECSCGNKLLMRVLTVLLTVAAVAPMASLAQVPQGQSTVAEILAEEDKNTLKLDGVEFAGNSAISLSELRSIAIPWLGKIVDSADIETLRHRIYTNYVNHGYIFAVVRVGSAQDKDGILRFDIMEGRLAEVRITGSEGLTFDYINKRLFTDGSLNVNELLDRYRLLLNDPLFASINSRLRPGTEPGLAALDIEVVRSKPYQIGIFSNNYRPPSIGANAVGTSGWIRNITGQGDTLEFNALDTQGSSPFSLSWNIPILASRTRLTVAYSEGRSSVIEAPMDAIGIKSDSKAVELGLTYPIVESASRRIIFGSAYINRESRTTLAGIPFSFTPGEPDGITRTYGVRLSQEWSEVDVKSHYILRSNFNFIQNNNLANGIDSPASNYAYWTGQAAWGHTLTEKGTQLALRCSMQYTSNRLLPIDRSPVGGVSTVRGYRENQLLGDVSNVVSLEFKVPVRYESKFWNDLFLIPFIDYGNAQNKGEARESLSSMGVGVNWRYLGWNTDAYWGARFHQVNNNTNETLQDHGIHFQIGYNFF